MCIIPIGNGGVLLIVANYTGDVFNFGLACEKAKKIDNINVNNFYIDCLSSENFTKITDLFPGGRVNSK